MSMMSSYSCEPGALVREDVIVSFYSTSLCRDMCCALHWFLMSIPYLTRTAVLISEHKMEFLILRMHSMDPRNIFKSEVPFSLLQLSLISKYLTKEP